MEQRIFSARKEISQEFGRYLASAFAGNVAIPIYSLFVPLLASRLGASLFEIGIVGGASNAVYSFMPFIMGRFSDRSDSRRFLIAASFGLLVGVSISYVLAPSPVYLIIVRIFEGIGWAMLWPAMDAAVSKDVAPNMDSKKAFSIYNVTWSLASALGPLIGSALIFLTSIRVAFLCTVFVMGFALLLNLLPILKQSSRSKTWKPYVGSRVEMRSGTILEQVSLSKNLGFGFYGGACALAAVSSGVLFTFFAPYARSIGMSILLIGVITFVFGMGRFMFYILTINEQIRHAILRSDKRVRNMLIALAMTSLAGLLIALRDPSGILYLFAYAIVGVGISIVFAISQAGLIAETSPEKLGQGAGLFESSIGFGACLGPILGGAISGSSPAVPFIVPSLGLVAFLMAFPLLKRKK
jgi:MFS family permease